MIQIICLERITFDRAIVGTADLRGVVTVHG